MLDTLPRPSGLTSTQKDALSILAMQVVSQFELRRSLAAQQANNRERDVLARVQAAVPMANGNLDAILAALVRNTMDAVPTAEGGVLELIDGDDLHYSAAYGSLAVHRGLRIPLKGSLAGSCAGANEAILVDDAR